MKTLSCLLAICIAVSSALCAQETVNETNTVVSSKEKPILSRIFLKGNKEIGTAVLKQYLQIQKKGTFDENKVKEDIDSMLQQYRKKGYPYAEITYKTEPADGSNNIILTYTINEREQVKISRISFEGASDAERKKISAFIKSKRKKYFEKTELDNDEKKIRDFYGNMGFKDAVVTRRIDRSADNTLADITFSVEKGTRYYIKSLALSGETLFSRQELGKVITTEENTLFKISDITASISNIRDLYAEKGCINISATPQYKDTGKEGDVDVVFVIVENRPVSVAGIKVKGLNFTRENVILREANSMKGSLYSGDEVKKSLARMYNLGFLVDVSVSTAPAEATDSVDLVFNAKEGRPGMISAGFGYSSIDYLVGTLQVTHFDLFGRGQKLNLLWEKGATIDSYFIGWTDPWFLDSKISFGADIYNLSRITPYYGIEQGYEEHREGGRIRLEPRFRDNLSLYTDFFSESESLRILTFSADGQIRQGVTGKILYNSTDNIWDASRGNRSQFAMQLAGGPLGGDMNYLKKILQGTWYFSTFWKFVLSCNLFYGDIDDIDTGVTPLLVQRFFLGGPDTIRGYSYQSLGPLYGGKAILYGNIEYKFPITREKGRTILQGVVFYDVGGAWRDWGYMSWGMGASGIWKQTGTWDNLMKASWGWGIRFVTPVFPIRLEWAYPFHPGAGMADSQFWFTVGKPFEDIF